MPPTSPQHRRSKTQLKEEFKELTGDTAPSRWLKSDLIKGIETAKRRFEYRENQKNSLTMERLENVYNIIKMNNNEPSPSSASQSLPPSSNNVSSAEPPVSQASPEDDAPSPYQTGFSHLKEECGIRVLENGVLYPQPELLLVELQKCIDACEKDRAILKFNEESGNFEAAIKGYILGRSQDSIETLDEKARLYRSTVTSQILETSQPTPETASGTESPNYDVCKTNSFNTGRGCAWRCERQPYCFYDMNQPSGERCTKKNVSSITLEIKPILDIGPPLHDHDQPGDVFPLDRIVEWYRKNTMHTFELVEVNHSNYTFKIRVEITELEKDYIRKVDDIESFFADPDDDWNYPLHGNASQYLTLHRAFITADVQIVD